MSAARHGSGGGPAPSAAQVDADGAHVADGLARDSSNVKNRQRSPSRQARPAKMAARLVLPVPAVPETRTLLPW